MTTLNIKDLSLNEELSGKEMASVRGSRRLFDVDINKETIKQFADANTIQNGGEPAGCTGCGLGNVSDRSSQFLNVYTG